MGILKQRGFTVIEVVLFLAVTGLIMSVMLIGLGTNVNRERYRDAVYSLADYFRGQYNATVNVINNQSGTTKCGNETLRGKSEQCVILGKLVRVTNNGSTVTSQHVYGLSDLLQVTSTSDTEALTQLASANQLVAADDETTERYSPEWGARLLVAGNNAGSGIARTSFLILRGPVNGGIYTYRADTESGTIADIIQSGLLTSDYTMCVDPVGLMGPNNTAVSGVRFHALGSSSSTVSVVGEEACP